MLKVSFFSFLYAKISFDRQDIFAGSYQKQKNISQEKNKKKRNLVLIYVESLETAYSDNSRFGKDLLKSLNEVTGGAYSFGNFENTYGAGWTIAGIVSTQCGIPIKDIALFDGNEIGEEMLDFLPGATCLGDILQENGYKNVFMGGASQIFSGKGKFLKTHGYNEIYGKEQWEELGYTKDDFNEWGLYDDELFLQAREKLDQLEINGEPFNLTILTLDQHPPEGFISKTCRKRGVHNFEGIVKCNADLVADFIKYIQTKGYNKNTDIVLTGDHLSMPNPVYEKLISNSRTIYNRFITSQTLNQNRDGFVHFDMFPTILYMLGFKLEEGRLALGVSGFGQASKGKSLFYDQERDAKLMQFSEKYIEFWHGNKKN